MKYGEDILGESQSGSMEITPQNLSTIGKKKGVLGNYGIKRYVINMVTFYLGFYNWLKF